MLNPRLRPLRNAVTNSRRFPHLTGKRLLACDLRRMPSFFNSYTRKTSK